MKNKLSKLSGSLTTVLLMIPTIVYGQGPNSSTSVGNNPNSSISVGNNPNSSVTTGSNIFQNPIKAKSIAQLVNDLFEAIIQIGLVFVVIAIIWSGLQFVLAQGSDEKLKTAKKTFMYTVIGGVILLGAAAITEVVCNTANQFLTTKISC